MRPRVKKIGIVLETRDDAAKNGAPLEHLYHWREPEEIAAVQKALSDLGFEAVLLGTPETLCASHERLRAGVDFILNLSVGFRSRFRLALGPALYELLHIPYSGADPFAKIVSQNKHILKSLLEKMGIPTPPWTFLQNDEDLEKSSFPNFPNMVKPAHEGSSIGIGQDSMVFDRASLRETARRNLHHLNMPVIVEKFITGREFKVGIIGNHTPKFIGLIEDTRADGSSLGAEYLFFDAKKAGRYGKTAQDIHLAEFGAISHDCARLHRFFTPLDYCTFDIRVDGEGNHFFLEFNADATLHPLRTLAQCCKLNGVPFTNMIALILESAFERWGLSWK